MSLFPEEQLDSSVGYFPGQPGQILNNGRWKIIRKLGWGTRSSSWLAIDTEDPGNIETLKIFTVAASEDPSPSQERRLLDTTLKTLFRDIPVLFDTFIETSPKGKHFVLVLHVLGTSIEAFRLSSEKAGPSLPLHIVQKIVADILESLHAVHESHIVHGAVTPDNFLFSAPQCSFDIMEVLSEPSEATAAVETLVAEDGIIYPVVKSQPFTSHSKWNDTRQEFANETIYLSNFGHARTAGGSVPLDAPLNLLPPEVVLGETFDKKADIWMLGLATYFLLTGSPLFTPALADSPREHLAQMLSLQGPEGSFSGRMLERCKRSDEFFDTSGTLKCSRSALTLEDLLTSSKQLEAKDIHLTASFIRSCLTLDPAKRPSAFDLVGNEWVEGGHTCSCGWCAADHPLLPVEGEETQPGM